MPNKDELDDRGRRIIEYAMERLNDPDIDAKLEEQESRKERRQELVLVGSRGMRDPEGHREVHLADMYELRQYLRMRGSNKSEFGTEFGLTGKDDPTRVLATWPEGSRELHLYSGEASAFVPVAKDGSVSSRDVERALRRLG